MTYTVRFAPEAQQQLDAIDIGVASCYPTVAAQFVDDIVAYCASFETFPERGMRRDDLLPGIRTIGFHRRITVAFSVDAANRVVVILGVFYGGRDFEAEIAQADPTTAKAERNHLAGSLTIQLGREPTHSGL